MSGIICLESSGMRSILADHFSSLQMGVTYCLNLAVSPVFQINAFKKKISHEGIISSYMN